MKSDWLTPKNLLREKDNRFWFSFFISSHLIRFSANKPLCTAFGCGFQIFNKCALWVVNYTVRRLV